MAEKQELNQLSAIKSAGATPVDPKQNGRPSSAKQGLHWFGECASPPPDNSLRRHQNGTSASASGLWFADDSTLEGKDGTQVDREERLRILKEKQNEERQRKLDELKQQALAAQKFREQKEEDRRRRLEELRLKDSDRRHQVEERKRQIWEAERDRREAILRKNQEREARIESKRRNERSQIVFAFGSSTPRMLEPGDVGSSYWATRRATSTTNVMTLSLSAAPGPLTRRSSERELDGSKKRATSAGGIERKHDPLRMTSSSIYEVFQWGGSPPNTPLERSFLNDDATDGPLVGVSGWRKDAARRKTDLMPTLPSSREGTPPSAGSRTPTGKKSSPGRAYSMSRLDILASPRRPRLPPPNSEPLGSAKPKVDVYRSMSVLPGSGGGGGERTGQKTAKIKVAKSMLHLGPTPPPRATRAERLRRKAREMAQGKSPEPSGLRSGEMTPSRPQSSMSQHSVASNLSSASASLRARSATAPRRPRPFSIAVTGVTSDPKITERNVKSPIAGGTEKPPIPKHSKKSTPKPESPATKKSTDKPKSTKSSASTTPKTTPIQSPIIELVDVSSNGGSTTTVTTTTTISEEGGIIEEVQTVETNAIGPVSTIEVAKPEVIPEKKPIEKPEITSLTDSQILDIGSDLNEADMTASMIAKVRITTEEEAKAALAERRRLAREQAEREAEQERQRLEAERLAEEERLRREEEEQKKMEEEQLRLLEEARKSEELRLKQAIEEAQKREEEERKRKEEELKLKIEKEEAEKKAKEEAEKMRLEMEQRLKKEEEDRQARRKRVEAIMLRTRGKGSMTSSSAQSKDGEDYDGSPPEEEKKDEALSESTETLQFINSERSHSDANAFQQNNRHNGHHHNGSYNSVTQNNVTNSLLVNLGEERVGEILDNGTGGKLSADAPTFIPQFQETKDPQTVNDLLS